MNFYAKLDDYLDGRGSIGLMAGLLGVIAFAGTLILLFGSITPQVVAIGAVALATIGAMLAIIVRSIKVERNLRRAEDLLRDYCGMVSHSSADPSWKVASWENVVRISKNGDTSEQITVKLVVSNDQFRFFRLSNGPGWLQPEWQARRVKIDSSRIAVERDGIDNPEWHLTSAWRESGKLEVLAHCRANIEPGTVVTLRLFYFWPGKCQPLMSGQEDSFKLRFRSGIEYLDYIVILPDQRDLDVAHVNESVQERANLSLKVHSDRGRQRVRLEARNVPAGESVGITIAIKGASPSRWTPPW